jgi:tetratricopeptide (TPR) repeat protein
MPSIFLAAFLMVGSLAAPESGEFTLLGLITTDRPAASIRVVLQDPRERNAEVASVQADKDGNYVFRGLQKRSYRLVTFVDGKRQDRRDIEIVCRAGATVMKDFHYGRSPSTLMLHFPAEDPDIIDVAELHGDYPREVLRDYERAFQDHISGNSARAIERLEGIAARAPQFYGAHARLGVIFQQEGCYSDAETEYGRASALSPRSPQPLLNLASVQIRAADIPGEREKMMARALETLGRALEVRPSSAIAYCLFGAARVKASSFEEAEKDFKRALELDTEFEAARLMLANLYIRQENWEGAIENLRIYLEDFPWSSDRSIVREMLDDARRKAREAQQSTLN